MTTTLKPDEAMWYELYGRMYRVVALAQSADEANAMCEADRRIGVLVGLECGTIILAMHSDQGWIPPIPPPPNTNIWVYNQS